MRLRGFDRTSAPGVHSRLVRFMAQRPHLPRNGLFGKLVSAMFGLPRLEDYAGLIGRPGVERIREKARALEGARVVHVNSTYYGGGVAEMLASLTLLMNDLGIAAAWRVMRGTPEFFHVTKKMHNALQGGPVGLTAQDTRVYQQVVHENAARQLLDREGDALVVIHDPQPLALIQHCVKRAPWVWRCHIDLSSPDRELWRFLAPYVEKYDAAILSCPQYAQQVATPQRFFLPAIDPFSAKNRELTGAQMDAVLSRYRIPTDLPLIVQVSRFDPWKDPSGVIEAFRLARKDVEATLVLLGNFAADDPEGAEIYRSLLACREERILVLPHGDDVDLVNALQRRAAVVLQKSLREGFGLTVTEAMWKGTPVIGGAVGGIPTQIDHGGNGFLVSSVEETAARIVQLLGDEKLRLRMGREAREKARRNFLLTRYLEQYLDLFASLGIARGLQQAA